jgi:hypothetical protein
MSVPERILCINYENMYKIEIALNPKLSWQFFLSNIEKAKNCL